MVYKRLSERHTNRRAGSDTGRGTGLSKTTIANSDGGMAHRFGGDRFCLCRVVLGRRPIRPRLFQSLALPPAMMAQHRIVRHDGVSDGPIADDDDDGGGSTAPLPETVAYVPVVKPAEAFTALQDGTTATRRQ